ncbi:hypothetical protein GUJ93_ZPchr0010g10119 [Zizania palustris]|uniref:Rhodanese domain-containing protein n=1 Tax=Zizania palustris TaxID=103762 RepID=A0A8J6BBS2_ZIZPA|nr:hypothetical protein GUJ93_ZPchr0010g10119 [Zizania palustris]
MLISPPLAALSKAAARRAATVAAAARRRLPLVALPGAASLGVPELTSALRRRVRLMPQEDAGRTRGAPLPLPSHGRGFAADVGGSGGVDGGSPELLVVSFYRFADFPDHGALRRPLKELCEELRVSGGIILAPEGINGSICGTPEAVEQVLNFIQSDNRLKGLRMIQSPVTPEDEAIHHGHTSHSPVGAGEDAPFRWDHVRVKLKKEIVTLGDPGVMPTKMVGKYVKPKDWNALISDPDTVVIDVRNMYEIRIGKFKRAVDPCTKSFREFSSWVDDQFELTESESNPSSGNNDNGTGEPSEDLNSSEPKELPRVAMYCTGGIRCEKASSFLLSKGFKEVYHLEGGILKYLEEIPKAESLWEGECFVFDKRVSVEHGLAQGTHKLCYGCKQPVNDEDMESPEWEYGVSCPYCIATKSEEEKERARARQRQFETWGVIGGPDKGRSPKRLEANYAVEEAKQLSSSI